MADAELNQMRVDYQRGQLDENDVAADPIAQFARWFDEAKAADVHEPNAMTLATSTPDGRPSARIVLLKDFDARGFTFYTNYGSRKGDELAANPFAALLFFWPTLERQVRIEGGVARVARDESAAYFAVRPRDAQLGAHASHQSKIIASRGVLERRQSQLASTFADVVPLPDEWGGYRVRATSLEFWQGRPSRLHDRLRYRRTADDAWSLDRLSP